MARSALKDTRVVELAKKFIPVLVNFDTNKKIAGAHGVQSIPAIVYVDSDLEAVEWSLDELPADRLLEEMTAAYDELIEDAAAGDDDMEDHDEMDDGE